MRLTINGEKVSYSLESERTLGEVVGGVHAWLAASGFLLTGLEADARDLLALPAEAWVSLELGGIAELRVAATHTGEMRIEHWRTVHAWLAMLLDEMLDPTPVPPGTAEFDSLQELLDGLPQTLESISANPFLPAGSDLARRFQALFNAARAAEVRAWPAERRSEAVSIVTEMRTRVEARLSDALHAEKALARSARALKELQAGLSEVSVMLQTGRDRQAMSIVIGFTDAAQGLIDVLPFLPPDAERARLISDLTPILRQLVEAFHARDAILIGDLLEYEIAPRMERITPLLERAV